MRGSRVISVGAALLAAASGCSKENEVDSSQTGNSVGLQCAGANDPACGTSGVCVLGFCRTGCSTDAECPQGTLCIGDQAPFGCQLSWDLSCSTGQQCKAGLACGLDLTCRIPCSASSACPRNEQLCIEGACYGKSEQQAGKWSCEGSAQGARRCKDLLAQVCDVGGLGWVDAETCKVFCIEGVCSGDCTPGETGCDGDQPRTCDSAGNWQPCTDCAFLKSDSHNCGACGHDCGVGACTDGMCPAQVLVPPGGAGHDYSLALAGDEVIWADSFYTSENGGLLSRMPKSGGASTTMATGLQRPGNVQVSGTEIWWVAAQNATQGGALMHLPLSGGSPVARLQPINIGGLILDSTHAYFFQGMGVSRLPLASGNPEVLAPTQMPVSMAIDASSLYWADMPEPPLSGYRVMRVPLAGGTAVELVSNGTDDGAGSLAVDAASVYWTCGLKLLKAPLEGGVPTTIITLISPPGLILVDGKYIYGTWWNPPVSTIFRQGVGGGVPLVLATGNMTRVVAVDDAYVYWASQEAGIGRTAK